MKITWAIPLEERFELQHEPVPECGCWLWTGTTNPAGYGRLNVKGKVHLAHRVAWMLRHGEIPAGMHACHKCDTPGCVNPDHLFLGDNDANHADKCAKGRQGAARGESSGQAKLTDDQVRAIREDQRLARVVAPEYGVTPRYICQLRRGQWRKACV